MTERQLRGKRNEFWETAPAFEGRKEIWDALKAASEQEDISMAQAIVDSANITLPTGTIFVYVPKQTHSRLYINNFGISYK